MAKNKDKSASTETDTQENGYKLGYKVFFTLFVISLFGLFLVALNSSFKASQFNDLATDYAV